MAMPASVLETRIEGLPPDLSLSTETSTRTPSSPSRRCALRVSPRPGGAVAKFDEGVSMAYLIGIVLSVGGALFARCVEFDRDRAFIRPYSL